MRKELPKQPEHVRHFQIDKLFTFKNDIVVYLVHFSEPTSEQIQMYTNVLRGIIRLSTLVFPENLKPAEIDALAR